MNESKKVNEFFDFMLTAAEIIFHVFLRSATKQTKNMHETKGRRERAMNETQMFVCYVKVV